MAIQSIQPNGQSTQAEWQCKPVCTTKIQTMLDNGDVYAIEIRFPQCLNVVSFQCNRGVHGKKLHKQVVYHSIGCLPCVKPQKSGFQVGGVWGGGGVPDQKFIGGCVYWTK